MEKEGLQELSDALPSSNVPAVHVEICQKPYRYIVLNIKDILNIIVHSFPNNLYILAAQ